MLDKRSILEQYGEYLHQQWAKDPKMVEIDAIVQTAMKEVEDRKMEILAQPAIYKSVITKVTTKNRIGKWKIPIISIMTISKYKQLLLKNKIVKYIVK